MPSGKWSGIQSSKTAKWSIEGRTEAIQAIRKRTTKERKGTSRSCGFITFAKKGPSDLGGRRGRMISPSNRALAVELIQEANQNGARLAKACEELHISVRTYERWVARW